jgi:hypothetical protein
MNRMSMFDLGYAVRSGFIDGDPLELSGDIPKAIIEAAITLKRDKIATEDEFNCIAVKFPRFGAFIQLELSRVKKDGSLPYYLRRALTKLGIDHLPDPEDYAHQP